MVRDTLTQDTNKPVQRAQSSAANYPRPIFRHLRAVSRIQVSPDNASPSIAYCGSR